MLIRIDTLKISGLGILVREDFNTPIQDGVIQNDARLRAALPTLHYLLSQKPKFILLMSHLGQPKADHIDLKYSLAPIAAALSSLLGKKVHFLPQWPISRHILEETAEESPLFLMENVRFLKGEEEDDDELAQTMASLADIFVMDAFASAHRSHASTHGVARFAKKACAGLLLMAEIKAISTVLHQPQTPLVTLIGGAKISTKIKLLKHCATLASDLVIGGGMANTFLLAQGHEIGQSLAEPECIEEAQKILHWAEKNSCRIHLPLDVAVGRIDSDCAMNKSLDTVRPEDNILDIGSSTLEAYAAVIHSAKTLIWNGPMGMFEMSAFRKGTLGVAQAIAKSNAFSLAGGGDTLAALEITHLSSKITYLSTGGGAMLAMLEGETLPGIDLLYTPVQ